MVAITVKESLLEQYAELKDTDNYLDFLSTERMKLLFLKRVASGIEDSIRGERFAIRPVTALRLEEPHTAAGTPQLLLYRENFMGFKEQPLVYTTADGNPRFLAVNGKETRQIMVEERAEYELALRIKGIRSRFLLPDTDYTF